MNGGTGAVVSIWIVAGAIFFLVLLCVALKAVGRGTGTSNAGNLQGSQPPELGHVSTFLDLSSVPQRFVVFDLETTGLSPTRHEIIEIGAIRVNRDSDVHEAFQSLVKPLRRIPKKITQMTGISQDMVDREGEALETVLGDFAEFIEDLPLVSFNAEFDMGFLQNSAKRHNIVIRNRASCALKMARRAWPDETAIGCATLRKMGTCQPRIPTGLLAIASGRYSSTLRLPRYWLQGERSDEGRALR